MVKACIAFKRRVGSTLSNIVANGVLLVASIVVQIYTNRPLAAIHDTLKVQKSTSHLLNV